MNKAVGKRVKRLRLDKEMSQLALADKSGVTANTIRGLEKGTLNTRWPKIQKIARALGTTPEALIHGDEEIAPTDPLLAGLNREDFQIARLYHDATTATRQRIAAALNAQENDRVSKIALWLQRAEPNTLLLFEQFMTVDSARLDSLLSAMQNEYKGRK